jgi:glycosyltransferase involved in cell wall biosynthesis
MTLTNAGNLTDAYIVTPEGVATALERLYQNEDYRNEIAEAGFKNARRPEYRWSSVAAAWKELFMELIER